MGKLNQGAFQGFIGKTGGLVGKRYQGNYVISAYQPIVKNPKSFKQMSQRDNFKQAIVYIKDNFSVAVRSNFWKSFSGGLTGRASSIKTYLKTITFYNRYMPVGYSPVAPPQLNIGAISGGMPFRNDLFGNWVKQVTPAGYALVDAGGLPMDGVRYFGSDVVLENFWLRTDVPELVNNKLSWFIYKGEEASALTLEDRSLVVFDTIGKIGGFHDTAAACGSDWNYIYKVRMGAVEPLVPLTVGKIVNQGTNGAATGGRWKDNQFLVSLEFVGTDAMKSGVGQPVIEYDPA